MPTWKLNIFTAAFKTRMSNGETLEQVLGSYPKLTEEEKQEIQSKL